MRYSTQGSGQSSMGQYQGFRSDGPISHPKRRIWSSVSLVVQPSDFYLFLASKFEVSLFKTMLTKSRLCDSFLHPGTLSFTRVFSSNLLQGTVKNPMGLTTLTEDQIYRFGWEIGSSDLKPRPCFIQLLPVPWIESRNIGTLLSKLCWDDPSCTKIPCISGHWVLPEWFLQISNTLRKMHKCR